jgi:hypothetical protein
METSDFSEMPVYFYQTTRCYVAEDNVSLQELIVFRRRDLQLLYLACRGFQKPFFIRFNIIGPKNFNNDRSYCNGICQPGVVSRQQE